MSDAISIPATGRQDPGTTPSDATRLDADAHLRAGLDRLLRGLARLLRAQRTRGRTSLGDPMHGLVIEDGEAEGLLSTLAHRWCVPRVGDGRESEADPERAGLRQRRAIAERAHAATREGAVLPLVEAECAFSLEPAEADALLLALAVELDPVFGRLVAYMNDHVQRTRPTIGLAVALAGVDRLASLAPYDFLERSAVRNGLLLVDGEGPAPGLALRVAPDLIGHFARGRSRAPAPVQVVAPVEGALGRLVLAEHVRTMAREWARRARAGQVPPLVLVGPPGSGRGTLAAAIAAEAGLTLVAATVPKEHPESILQMARRELTFLGDRAAFLAEHERDGAPAPLVFGDLPAHIMAAATPSTVDRVVATMPREPVVLTLADIGPSARARLWEALVPGGERLEDQAVAALAARFRFPVGSMARAIERAKAAAVLAPEGNKGLTASALEQACRDIGAEAMGPLAQKLPLPYVRADLVAPPRVERELTLALAWIRHQATVLDGWGFGRRVAFGRGLTALFAGEPGTGKTMAVQVLARELRVDAFRVDLSRVMSKYIGETEKHLSVLFDQAAAAGAMLFFDEADALFGKRSEVSDAHDRYANVEIGYLLQRMEEHDGITVLATNRQRDLDEAFVRRFHVIVDFPMPLEADRLRIWKGMIPAEARTEGLDVAALARDYETSGGEIKNAALAAAFLAAEEGTTMTMRHLRQAVRRELLKSGKTVDERD